MASLNDDGTNIFEINFRSNNLDRDNAHDALIPASLTDWFSSEPDIVFISDQGDITAPVIASTDTIDREVFGPFAYDLVVDENSYAVDTAGE